MYQDVFHSVGEALDKELWNSLNDAEKLGILTPERVAYLWFYREEGMKWLNDTPDTIYICDLCGNEGYSELHTADDHNHYCDKCWEELKDKTECMENQKLEDVE